MVIYSGKRGTTQGRHTSILPSKGSCVAARPKVAVGAGVARAVPPAHVPSQPLCCEFHGCASYCAGQRPRQAAEEHGRRPSWKELLAARLCAVRAGGRLLSPPRWLCFVHVLLFICQSAGFCQGLCQAHVTCTHCQACTSQHAPTTSAANHKAYTAFAFAFAQAKLRSHVINAILCDCPISESAEHPVTMAISTDSLRGILAAVFEGRGG